MFNLVPIRKATPEPGFFISRTFDRPAHNSLKEPEKLTQQKNLARNPLVYMTKDSETETIWDYSQDEIRTRASKSPIQYKECNKLINHSGSLKKPKHKPKVVSFEYKYSTRETKKSYRITTDISRSILFPPILRNSFKYTSNKDQTKPK
ncbi:hypothetical protein SteCoe_26601 [Stentor coeruleus]|uniref:Uncharacterized protein n=1 Tax=Stentor coeruleus TaxID=5963 RepID=A0A1R2BCJ0_9CILI|nr:hypothetical protein SteCoe_26601 [Stentor coeruleus]